MKNATDYLTADATGRGTGYRAHLQFPEGVDAIAIAERHVRQWLRQKLSGSGVVDAWDGESSHRFDDQFSITVVSRDDEQSDIHRRLYRLVDHNRAGRFWISLFAVASKNGTHGSVVVEGAVEGKGAEDAVDAVATPRLVREILDDVEARDSTTRLTGTPMLVHADDVSVVLSAIHDPGRQVAVIVASSLSRDVDEVWKDLIARLTSNSVGVAAAFVLSGEAVDVLNAALPVSHQVPRGTVRTFASSVDVSDPADGLAHRFLGPSTLARSVRGSRITNRRLIEVHARGPRTRLLERQLPGEVRRSIDLLEREERRGQLVDEVARRVANADTDPSTAQYDDSQARSVDAPVEVSTVGDSVVERVRGLFRRWLGREPEGTHVVAELDSFIASAVQKADVATEYTEHVEYANRKLETALDTFREQLDERDFDIALTAEELRSAERENRYLRHRLREHHEYQPEVGASDDLETWDPPADVEELIDRLTPGAGAHLALERVEFTGRHSAVAEVHKRDPYGKYAQDLWEYVRVLFEYAQLRASGGYDGNVHMYLSDDSLDSFRCAPQRHAARESDSVLSNDRWRHERMLPVPEAVDAAGEILMGAHFKPTHRDQFAPRMHYFDDAAGTGKIYIGYIGRHLTNTKPRSTDGLG